MLSLWHVPGGGVFRYNHSWMQEVACSLHVSNPGLPLLVMTVASDLSPGVEAAVAGVARVVHVPELSFPNTMRDGRYGTAVRGFRSACWWEQAREMGF